MASALSFHSLGKVYKSGFWGKRYEALKDLTLEVPAGSVFGFLGANGAGKTTTIKIVLGLQYSTSGTVEIWGRPLSDQSTKERIGYLPERPVFHGDLTANEFLNFHRSLFNDQSRQSRGPSNKDLLTLVGIPDVGDRLLREFSKGMLQRIGIAQALVNSPDLVILDEPMSGLDPVGRRDVRILIDRLAKEGKTIFFSTHILSDVETLCDQLAFLERGVLKAHGTLGDILTSKTQFKKEIIFDNVQEEKLRSHPALGASARFGTAWKIMVDNPAAIQPTIEAVWQLKGNIVAVTSPQMTLEAALFPTMKSD